MADWFEKQCLGDLPEKAARQWPGQEALVFGDERYTFTELHQRVEQTAATLMHLGVEPGDKVGLWMVNRPEFIFLMFAVARVGAVLVPLNTRYRTDDVAYTIRQSDCRLLLAMDRSGPVDYAGMLRQVLPGTEAPFAGYPELKQVVIFGRQDRDWPRWEEAEQAAAAMPVEKVRERAAGVDPDGLLLLAYTSGTTGHPKGVMHSHCCIRKVTDTCNRMGVTRTDVIMNYLPLFHLYAYSACAMQSMLTGAKQVLLDGFDAGTVLDLIEKEGGTIIHGFDTHYRELMLEQGRLSRDVSSLRIGTFPAGSDSTAAVARETQAVLCPTLSLYGMTELWSFATLSFADSTPGQRCDASGYPAPGLEFRIVDSGGGIAGPGVPGEIQVRGYMVTRGYYKKPEATAAAFDGEWFRTGDAGLMRPDGHLQFLGREKDMLKVGGENVSPAEVEGFLLTMDEIDEVAVVGYPDERLSEVAVAFVVGRPVNAGDLQTWCRGRIASYKIPVQVIMTKSLPMTATGKVRKNLLRQRALEEL